jgi:N-acetyl-alpha-D-muramate 1-phosphate uridylyltransferase
LQCVILAGGRGERMRPLTDSIPKALIPVNGVPFASHQLDRLARQGVDRVVYSIGYRGDLVREHVGDGGRWGLAVDYVDEGDELRGTAGALRFAFDEGVLRDRFFVLYGDSYLPIALDPVWKAFDEARLPALMTVLRNEGRWDRSNAAVEDRLVTIYDKSGADTNEPLDWIDYGLSALQRSVVEARVPAGEAADLADLFRELSADRLLGAFEVEERFFEIGSPAGLSDLERHLRQK